MNASSNITANATPTRILHTMLRVTDLERSLAFYTEKLGMKLLRKEEYPGGRFTLAFVGYGDEKTEAVIELTYNWDRDAYEHGSAFGHIALAVEDLESSCANLHLSGVQITRAPGPMTFSSPDRNDKERIAFLKDPDGYQIELIQI
jgi:lactoylglutathione lyase